MAANLITVLGPTAVGKTSIAAKLALDLSGEIISADSRQVYKKMDIGTGKDLEEFKTRKIKYYLIDIVEPSEEYNLFRFKHDFYSSFIDITTQNKLPILVGGTGLYLSSILQNYDLKEAENNQHEYETLNELTIEELQEKLITLHPDQHNTTDLIEKNRLIKAIQIANASGKKQPDPDLTKINSLNIGITTSRSEIKKRITARLKQRLDNGLIEEVEYLLKIIDHKKLQFFGLEYKYISLYLLGELNYNDMFQKLNSAIHNFAKRQMTWFRKMEKEGVKINWFESDTYDQIIDFVKDEMRNFIK
jgi:tRNA dimethylallyltransferase